VTTVQSHPYAWPYNGDLRPENTALVIIDMQTDFCGVGGYVDHMGYDLSLTQAPIAPIKALLADMRAKGYHIIHTREQALAQSADRGRDRRQRPLRQDPDPWRGGVGHHSGTRPAGGRDNHRQTRQGQFLCH